MKKIAINGFGRIGRASIKIAMESQELEIIAVNDLMSIENAAYLLKYDSVYRRYNKSVEIEGDALLIDGKKVLYLSVKDPVDLPWQKLAIDVVIESTGFFNTR